MKNTLLMRTAAGLTLASSFALLADETSAAKVLEMHKIEGRVVMAVGQKMPHKVSFVDAQAAQENRTSNPVPVKVDKDGKFEVDLANLPSGYVLKTIPCSRPKKVLLNGEDILAKQEAAAAAQVGAAGIARTVGIIGGSLGIGEGVAGIAASLLGGVKFNDCGNQ